MSPAVQNALASLRDLGSVEQMQQLAASDFAPASRPRLNMHIHLPPNFSAFESIEQAVTLAEQQDVRVLCASNYYDFGVYGEFSAEARRRGIFPLFGTEIIAMIDDLLAEGVKINDPGNPGRMYICGKGITRFDRLSREAKRLLGSIRHNDSTRLTEMIAKLAEVFEQRGLATGLTAQTVKDIIVRRSGCPPEAVVLQERHAAQVFQEVFFEKVPSPQRTEMLSRILGTESTARGDDAVNVQGEIRTHLMKAGKIAFVPETFGDFQESYSLILELGGIPCYPTLADGASPICEYEEPVEKLIGNIKNLGVYCAEFIPIRNTPDVLSHYVHTVRKAGIVISGGTEHNTLDLLGMEPTCIDRKPVPDDVKDIFWEGACVVAAHQFLVLHGRCGFVDADGIPNPAYGGDEERIETLAKLGAAVIEKYFKTTSQKGAHAK